ncbi:hypothetical protein [Flavihumibacter petaseus]|uniref:Uncharacterized protein n=1 Tax=Flavihumibacter petaseus NBRC 106054 TaxID=1220578 RepID=A0A0E9N349_9BACT|nr:hypothetical protein [Flavihumibacter petaseus]GAO44096.1 hypothetical protein FPE01S_03_01360 [Flavihumibacter petaseus NBRC 106054]
MVTSSEPFLEKFRLQLFDLVEISVTEDADKLGTLVFGNSKSFVNKSIECATGRNGFEQWKELIQETLERTAPTSFLFKVDWKNNKSNNETLYFRYVTGVSEESMAHLLARYEALRTIPVAISKKYAIGLPVCISIRIHRSEAMSVSIYYEISGKTAGEIENILTGIAEMMQWPADAIQSMLCKLDFMTGIGHPQYMAIGIPDKAIKISYPKVSVRDFGTCLDSFTTQECRKKEMKSLCRKLRQPALNYLGLKFNQQGCGWKAYLVISKKHAANSINYNITF